MKLKTTANYQLLVLVFGSGIYFLLACWKLWLPGAHYDEFLFVDAASSANPTLFINKSFLNIPLLLMPYIGALKAWIHAPVFSLFDVNIYSVRLPMVLLGSATLLIYFEILRKFISQKLLLLISFLLICSDASFSFVSRMDWGPNAIAHFLIALFVLQFIWYLNSGSPRLLVTLILTAAVGIFDKLNFLWFINSALIAALLVYYQDLWRHLKKQAACNAVILVLAIVAAGFLLIFWILPATEVINQNRSLNFIEKCFKTYQQLPGILSAESIFSMVFAKSYPLRFSLILYCSYFFIFTAVFLKRNPKVDFARFCILVVLGILVQICLTNSAGGPHHFFSLLAIALVVYAANYSVSLGII